MMSKMLKRALLRKLLKPQQMQTKKVRVVLTKLTHQDLVLQIHYSLTRQVLQIRIILPQTIPQAQMMKAKVQKKKKKRRLSGHLIMKEKK